MPNQTKPEAPWKFELTTCEGALERISGPDVWGAPAMVVAAGEWLAYPVDTERRMVRSGPEMLREFLQLSDAEPESFASYAKRWGVLDVCSHDLPRRVSLLSTMESRDDTLGCAHTTACPVYAHELLGSTFRIEPLRVWRRYSAAFNALLNLATDIYRGGGVAKKSDVAAVKRLAEGLFDIFPGGLTKEEIVAWIIQILIDLSGVRPEFIWDEQPRVRLTATSLFQALVLQLVLAAAKLDGFAICCDCGLPYVPPRRPARGRDNYCEKCGRPAALRAAKRRYNDKKRQERPRNKRRSRKKQ